jgi:hypothetical protein
VTLAAAKAEMDLVRVEIMEEDMLTLPLQLGEVEQQVFLTIVQVLMLVGMVMVEQEVTLVKMDIMVVEQVPQVLSLFHTLSKNDQHIHFIYY